MSAVPAVNDVSMAKRYLAELLERMDLTIVLYRRINPAPPRPPVAHRADTDVVRADLGATPDEIEGWRRDGVVT